MQQLNQWKKVSKNIYIWDYINNFDDYLTPFPILKIAQQRLRFFKQNGASGIFFNGSGYSYSSFDAMRTFVLSALLINPELPVEELVRDYFNQEYPLSKKWLYDYYINLENSVQSGKKLGIYAGIAELEQSFLNPEKFIKFYDEMGDYVSDAKGKERKSSMNSRQPCLIHVWRWDATTVMILTDMPNETENKSNRLRKCGNGLPNSKNIMLSRGWSTIMNRPMKSTTI